MCRAPMVRPRGPQCPFLLTPEQCEWFNFHMGPLTNFSAVAVVALSLALLSSARAEDGNPLRDALVDPVGVLAPAAGETEKALPPLFNAQRGDYFFEPAEKGEPPMVGEVLGEDRSFQRAVADWEHFRPATLPLHEGAIFFGDPRLLLSSVPGRVAKPSAPGLQAPRSARRVAVGILAMLSLGWVYFRIRGRRTPPGTAL